MRKELTLINLGRKVTVIMPAGFESEGKALVAELTITRDSIKSAGGSINVVIPAPSGYSTCIKLELPHIQNEKEIN